VAGAHIVRSQPSCPTNHWSTSDLAGAGNCSSTRWGRYAARDILFCAGFS